MCPDARSTARELFDAAADLPEDQQRAYLDHRCGGDTALRREVERLLAHDSAAPADFLSSPLDRPPPAHVEPGDVVGGRFRIVRPLGEGGMGVVFLAEQTSPVQRAVALKLLRPGLEGEKVLARFAAERQSLAMMNHPGIARLYDAGDAGDGRPFFAMEYVEGAPITDHCDAVRLSVRQRVGLMVRVCDAVQHAHQKGVIHRDLKPSNILVSGSASALTIKIIDFGVAKAIGGPMGGSTVTTEPGQVIGTPEYMSPEQASTDDSGVDTRADVYSLGAVLYALLTGLTPLGASPTRSPGIVGALAALQEIEPPLPSTCVNRTAREAEGDDTGDTAMRRGVSGQMLRRTLEGDLDWIAMRALEKDPARRYQTVAALGDDLGRYLRDEPVNAGPPGLAYRAGKFVRRRRGLVVAAAVALSALGAGLAAAVWQAQRASLEARVSEEVSGLIRDILSSVDPARARGETVTVREMLDEAALRLVTNPPRRDRVRAALHDTIGTTYAQLGLYVESEPHFREALALYDATRGAGHRDTLRAAANLAFTLEQLDKLDEAEGVARAALAAARRRLGPDNDTTCNLIRNLGVIADAQGRADEAESLFREALAASTAKYGDRHEDPIRDMTNLGIRLFNLNRMDEAEPLLSRSLALGRDALGDDHPVTIAAMRNMVAAHQRLGRAAEANALVEEAAAACRRVYGPDAVQTLRCEMDVVKMLSGAGRLAEAEPIAAHLLEAFRARHGAAHIDTVAATELLVASIGLQGRFEEAEAIARDRYEEVRRGLGERHQYTARAASLMADLYESWEKPDLQRHWLEVAAQARAE